MLEEVEVVTQHFSFRIADKSEEGKVSRLEQMSGNGRPGEHLTSIDARRVQVTDVDNDEPAGHVDGPKHDPGVGMSGNLCEHVEHVEA